MDLKENLIYYASFQIPQKTLYSYYLIIMLTFLILAPLIGAIFSALMGRDKND